MVRELRLPRRVKSLRAPRRGVSPRAVRQDTLPQPNLLAISESTQEAAARESRAVPLSRVYGTILERIVYKALADKGIQADFQSSLVGGRAGWQFGRQVADFVLWRQGIVIECQGTYWHAKAEQHWRDIVRELVLAGEGWTTLYLEEDTILDPMRLNDWLDRNVVYGAVNHSNFSFSTPLQA